MKPLKYFSALLLGAGLLSGCSAHLKELAKGPEMTPPGQSRNPPPPAAEERIALSVARPRTEENAETASLWRSGPTSLFGDRRARTQGDIVTVVIEIDDRAEIQNQTDRSRESSEELQVPNFFGLPTLAQRVLPGGADLNPAVEISAESESNGDGAIRRQDRLTLQVAATVDRVLPNGHLVIIGSQEILVNRELRDLQVAGIIRPEDISRRNTITYEKIADARIMYGGRGTLSDIQDSRYGQKVFNAVTPF